MTGFKLACGTLLLLVAVAHTRDIRVQNAMDKVRNKIAPLEDNLPFGQERSGRGDGRFVLIMVCSILSKM